MKGFKLKITERSEHCGPPVTEHKTRETSIKQRTMPRREYGGLSTSSESGDSKADPFAEPTEKEDFVLPTPRSPSDEEEPSPSQYRQERLPDDAAETFEEDHTGPPEIVEVSDDEEEPPIKYSKYPKSNSQPPFSDQIYSQFINFSRDFISLMEDASKWC